MRNSSVGFTWRGFKPTWRAPLDTPRVLMDVLAAGGDPAKRAFAVIEPIRKLGVATIEAAVRGG